MSCLKKMSAVSISLFAIACSISLHAAQSEQAASSVRAGTSASRSTAGTTTASHSTAFGGGSSWTAGKGSFGSTNQTGGVWRAESAPSAVPGAARGTTPTASSAVRAFPSSNTVALGAYSPKPTNAKSGVSHGTAHFSRPSSGSHYGIAAGGRGSLSTSSSKRRVATGSQSRIGFSSSGTGGGKTGTASGLASTTMHLPSARKPIVSSPLGSLPKAGVRRSTLGTLP